jgi:eukaryotic-like serine/threonine-protein kinase
VAGGVVYVGGRDGRIRAYRATNGAALWSRLLNGPISSTPSIANGQVEIGTDAGRLYAFALP